eukprot:gene16939-biopygen1252
MYVQKATGNRPGSENIAAVRGMTHWIRGRTKLAAPGLLPRISLILDSLYIIGIDGVASLRRGARRRDGSSLEGVTATAWAATPAAAAAPAAGDVTGPTRQSIQPVHEKEGVPRECRLLPFLLLQCRGLFRHVTGIERTCDNRAPRPLGGRRSGIVQTSRVPAPPRSTPSCRAAPPPQRGGGRRARDLPAHDLLVLFANRELSSIASYHPRGFAVVPGRPAQPVSKPYAAPCPTARLW